MRHYLTNLREKPHHPKKNFAFAVSGGISLLIFAIWLSVNFGLASETGSQPVVDTHEVGPIEALVESLGSSVMSIKDGLSNLTQVISGAGVQDSYESMKSEALNQYGR